VDEGIDGLTELAATERRTGHGSSQVVEVLHRVQVEWDNRLESIVLLGVGQLPVRARSILEVRHNFGEA